VFRAAIRRCNAGLIRFNNASGTKYFGEFLCQLFTKMRSLVESGRCVVKESNLRLIGFQDDQETLNRIGSGVQLRGSWGNHSDNGAHKRDLRLYLPNFTNFRDIRRS